MKNSRIIALIIIALACIPKIHADDLSDMIATIAADRTAETASSINAGILGGIADAMTERGALDFIINSVSESKTQNLPQNYRQWSRGNLISTKGFMRPVPGIVTSNYGWRQEFNRMHHGVDLRLSVGDTVRAAMSGVVKKIGFDKNGYGHYVVLTHPDGMETLYGHLQYALAFTGQFIQIGLPVGIGGNTGNSTGPHLHFEARLNGIAVDPTMIFNFSTGAVDYGQDMQRASKTQQTNTLLMGNILPEKRTYIVREGDTPATIAHRAGISVMKLCQLNMISDTEPLQIGRMLKLK